MRVRFQVKVVQKRSQKHLEIKFEVIVAVTEQEETEIMLKECRVSY